MTAVESVSVLAVCENSCPLGDLVADGKVDVGETFKDLRDVASVDAVDDLMVDELDERGTDNNSLPESSVDVVGSDSTLLLIKVIETPVEEYLFFEDNNVVGGIISDLDEVIEESAHNDSVLEGIDVVMSVDEEAVP